MTDLTEAMSKLERLEGTLDEAWNDRADLESLRDALEDALDLVRDQLYLYASMSSAASIQLLEAGTIVRAIACADPGTTPRLYLEHVRLGAEDMPLIVERRVEVRHPALETLCELRFDGDRVRFVADSGDESKHCSVEASLTRLGDNATRESRTG